MAQVTLRDYLQEIEDAISLERVDDALTRCQHVLVQFPESLEVQRLLGEVYLAQGQMANAQQSLDWVLTNDPENVIAYCDRALICERLSDFDTALDCYQQAYELSHGNSQIRQEFNILSTKTGQQGFMFSRAGLARLYMRGGLLPQAVQEWEAVLAVNPDRLDARIGLLEACWREGLYDRAEQLANQILQDVPDCLKALLLLAHMTAPRDMQQAQELIRRAETLDPDFLMAQELFEDMMASRPGHPFLKLLKKPPVVLNDDDNAVAILSSIPTSEEPIVVPDSLLHEDSASNSLFDNWSGLENWNGVDTLIKPKPDEQPVSEAPALPSWISDTFASPSDDPWKVLEKQQEPQTQEDSFAITHQDSSQPEAWSQNAVEDEAATSSQSDTQLQSDPAHFTEPTVDSATSLSNTKDNDAFDNANPWTSSSQEDALASPPAWLSMLTQEEQRDQRQPDGVMPSMQSEQQSSASSTAQQPIGSEATVSAEESSSQAEVLASPGGADEEPFFFGPEWLKSLGAATINSSSQEEPVLATSVPPAEASTTPVTLSATVESEPSSFETDAWSDYMSSLPQQSEQAEQNLITTLEDLEQDLRSQGFIPLEPNSLSAIAQAQETAPSIEPAEDEPVRQVEETYGDTAQQETILSSALAQFGNFTTSSASDAQVASALSAPSSQQALETGVPTPVPLWASELRTVPAPAPNREDEQPAMSPVHFEESTGSVSNPIPVEPLSVSQEQSAAPLTRIEAFPNPSFEPSPIPENAPEVEPMKVPVARTDAFYDSELETTMKRPAVRLQPLQQGSVAQQSLPSATGRGRGGEPWPASGGGKDNSQSYQERLAKGYQHQLVGDYDEAMQEYRIIIRSAPELLADVISNVRALLKLAPMYSAGYRVLGDAYMRQGEYLQAMEAYNKALTMTKKAKA